MRKDEPDIGSLRPVLRQLLLETVRVWRDSGRGAAGRYMGRVAQRKGVSEREVTKVAAMVRVICSNE